MEDWQRPDRRSRKDRRYRPTTPLSTASLSGYRKAHRRKEDRAQDHYVDRYRPKLFILVLVTILLSITDAVFTLKLVSRGAQEINPIMNFFLKLGPAPFLAVKYFLTGGSLIVFLIHKNFAVFGGKIRVKGILFSVFLMYVLLIFYEIVLLQTIPSY